MQRKAIITTIYLVSCIILTACSPSEAELAATSTEMTANIYGTLTAEAPTLTPTATSTASPTSTSTKKPTKTLKPTATPKFPIPKDWEIHDGDNFSLAIPKRWKTIDLDSNEINELLEILKDYDVESEDSLAFAIVMEIFQENIEFWAVDGKLSEEENLATMFVTYDPNPIAPNINDLCQQMYSAIARSGFQITNVKCNLEINQLEVARFSLKGSFDTFKIKMYQYIYLRDGRTWTISFMTFEGYFDEFQSLFEQIAETFRVE